MVSLSIRPENVELSDNANNCGETENSCTGTVNQKVFLGDFIDFQVKVGDNVLFSRAHPNLRTPVGDAIHVRVAPDKCVVLSEGTN